MLLTMSTTRWMVRGLSSSSMRTTSHQSRIRMSSSSAVAILLQGRHHDQRPTFFSSSRLFSSSSYGTNMNQEDLMESDMLIAVNELDQQVRAPTDDTDKTPSSLSKRQGHTFTPATPRAVLHRAFSLFLFDADGRMLLTQRAPGKITFPNVWTNACCSHPLVGMPTHLPGKSEVDDPAVDYPDFPGIKYAAWRKTWHELGLDLRREIVEEEQSGDDNTDDNNDAQQQQQLQLQDKIQFLTRFHYWAADAITYGTTTNDCVWGEHEVDYVLFLQLPRRAEDIPLRPNPDEVADYQWVTEAELKDMLEERDSSSSALLWSPWFVGILERGGYDWWRDLPGSLAGRYTNDDIDYFDPPAAHHAEYNLPSHVRTTTGVWKDRVV